MIKKHSVNNSYVKTSRSPLSQGHETINGGRPISTKRDDGGERPATLCYECLEQGIIGRTMDIYYVHDVAFIRPVALPVHNTCALQKGLKRASKEVSR
jgi:hypothetical protein